MIAEGTHTAKPIDWGIVERGDYVKAVITFKTENDDYGTWTGSLDDLNFAKYTVETLARCGFTPTNKAELIKGLTAGPEGRALDADKTVDIVVEYTETQTGKVYANVKYVNDHGSKFQNLLSAEQAAKRLAGVKLEELFPNAAPLKKESQAGLDDLPF